MTPDRFAGDIRTALDLHRAGRASEAAAIYRMVLSRAPDHPDALHMMGVIATANGDPARGLRLIGKVVRRLPDFADAHLNLGNAHHALGQADQALACYRRAVALTPSSAIARSSLGRQLGSAGRDAEAIAHCQEAIRLDPRMAEAYVSLGLACWRIGRIAAAEAALTEAARLQPGRADILQPLGRIHAERSDFERARACGEAVLRALPRDAAAHRDLGMWRFRGGDTDGGVASLRRAVALMPDFVAGWLGLGWALRALGRFAEAVACFRHALAIDPDSAEAQRSLVETGEAVATAEPMDHLAAQLADPAQETTVRISAGFALGRLLDGQDRHDDAFAAFAQANALMRGRLIAQGRAYDPAAMEHRVQQLRASMTAPFLAEAARAGVTSELPVFIVGMPRSGTTLVEQILASHRDVVGAGELTDMPRITARLAATDVPDERPTPAAWQARLPALAAEHLARLDGLGGGAARVIDKLPDNIFHLGTIAALFPRARVILCARDPRDIGLSNYFQFFAGGNPYAYDLAECGHRCVQVARLAEHWKQVLTQPVMTVSYEALVAEPEATSRALVAFLGLDWDPACLAFHRSERVVVTQSTWQVRQPLHTRSVSRWRHYAAHLQELFETLAAAPAAP